MKIPKRFNFIKFKKNKYQYETNCLKVKIPSQEYPLNSDLDIFIYENTDILKDDKIIHLIDQIPYKIGCCYSNSNNIYNLLLKNNVYSKIYVGWLLLGNSIPVHHCWIVYKNKYLIDISDDIDCFLYNLTKNHIDINSLSEKDQKDLLLDFTKHSILHKNSERCHLGKVSYNNIYIGSQCNAEEGKRIFNKLLNKYPNHPCLAKNTDKNGMTPFQKEFYNS